MDKLTEKAQTAMQTATQVAATHHHQYLEPAHLLLALLADESVIKHLSAAGGHAIQLEASANTLLAKFPKVQGNQQQAASPALLRVIEGATKAASSLQDQYIGREALLLGLFAESKIQQILQTANIRREVLLQVIKQSRGGKTLNSSNAESANEALEKYMHDLTEAARAGKLDPVIGRDEEIRRTIQVLSRRTKNNPVLIGEPGVGKTAIAEGLAQRIIAEDVPDSLKNKRVLSLDLGLLLAGAKFRGEFEERLKDVLAQIIESAGEIIVFIDELHTLVGAGASDGAMDASNMMKPALARGELHCVGATTLAEYRKYIENDTALARRFQTILVEEPSIPETVSILRGLKEKYELHHGVRISDAAILAASKLSARYISGRFLPDKAIDVVDEAASRLRMMVDSKPEDIDELDRQVLHLKIEREALRKENDEKSLTRLSALDAELAELEAEAEAKTAKWQAERDKLSRATDVKEKLDHARQELEKAKREGAFERAGELAYSTIPALEAMQQNAEKQPTEAILSEVIGADDIASVIARWTGIPVDRLLQGEKDRLLEMESALSARVVGQAEALKKVSQVIRRARAGLQDESRPIGSFLFLGSTGVGKTELTKALAEFLFEQDTAILRFDMSEYMERHAVARLIGAPPGYVGHDEGGGLTEAIRRKPYQVILFDEIEKAHADVFNVLLQVLDDGRMTDGKGNTVDFRHSVIILTSNLGAEHLQPDSVDAAGVLTGFARDQVMETVRGAFRPEFLNRLDEMMIFNRLMPEHMADIVMIELQAVQKRLAEREITLTIEEAAIEYLARVGYDAHYGARPLKRTVLQLLINPLAEKILSGDIAPEAELNLSANDQRLLLNGSSLRTL